jgi:hypothetical protein
MKNIAILFTIVLSAFSGNLKSQNCYSYIRENCQSYAELGFQYNSQSKSAVFAKGQTSKLKLVTYRGLDYRIVVCADPIFGDNIEIRLVDVKSGDVLFTNATNGYDKTIEFSNETSKMMFLEVILPGGGGEETASTSKGGQDFTEKSNKGCLGVLIEQKKTQKTGF